MSITRRSMLAAVPAMGMAPIVPAMAEPVADAEILALFDEWRAEYDLAAVEDEESHVHYDRLSEIERSLAGLTPSTAIGMSAKLLALTSYGDFLLEGVAATVLTDALHSVGGVAPKHIRNDLTAPAA